MIRALQSTGTAKTVYTVTYTPFHCHKGTIRDENTNHAGRTVAMSDGKLKKEEKLYTYDTDSVVSTLSYRVAYCIVRMQTFLII